MVAPSVERALMARVEPQGLVVLLDRPRVVALRPTQPGASDVHLRRAHAVCDCRARIRKRAVVILERGAHARSQTERDRIAWFDSNYGVEISEGAIGVVPARAQRRPVQERLGIAGILRDRPVVGGKRLTCAFFRQAFVAVECGGRRKYQPADVREVNLALAPGREHTMRPQEVGAEDYLG